MMDIQAALGIHQLARVERNWTRRKDIWEQYQRALASLPIGLPAKVDPKDRHAYHLYTIHISSERSGIERDEFLDKMNAAGIGTGVHYVSIPEHPYYQQRCGWKPEQWPKAAKIGRETVSLPLSPALSSSDVDRVISETMSIVGRA